MILSVTAVLERVVADHARGRSAGIEVLEGCVSFIRLFADLCHHGKEETLLFPALSRSGLPLDDGPIAVMLEEHERGRALVREMADSLTGHPAGADRFMDAADEYVALIRDHIAKEDAVLFDLADQLVSGAAVDDLVEGYAGVDLELFEGRSKVELETMAGELVAGLHALERSQRE